jgi:hypothetical protein
MQASMHVIEALWSFHPVMEVFLAVIMYRRKLHRQFPIFFAYILFQVVLFAILFPIYWFQVPRACTSSVTGSAPLFVGFSGSRSSMKSFWPCFIHFPR